MHYCKFSVNCAPAFRDCAAHERGVGMNALTSAGAVGAEHSLLAFRQPRALEMLKLYFLFSLQFLVKEGYVDREGNPMGFAGLVSHLHYHEPSNLVFVSFLVKGLFHNLCQPTRRGVPGGSPRGL
nr:probable ATP-dependent RNA helicase DDX60 [Camelus dromedarius]